MINKRFDFETLKKLYPIKDSIKNRIKTAAFYGIGIAIAIYDGYKARGKEKDLFDHTMDYLIG